MEKLLFASVILITIISCGKPDARAGNYLCPDQYSILSEMPGAMEKEAAHPDYEEGMIYSYLFNTSFSCNLKIANAQGQAFYDEICNIFQPPR
jgi:hypothetical protein